MTYSKNIDEAIGHLKLKNVSTKILETFYSDLKANTTFAPKTIKHHYTIISNMFNTAINWGYITMNPNARVTPPKVKQKEIEYYTPDEVQELIEALQTESTRNKAIILLALDSGIRRGELTGLTWDDIDLKKRNY